MPFAWASTTFANPWGVWLWRSSPTTPQPCHTSRSSGERFPRCSTARLNSFSVGRSVWRSLWFPNLSWGRRTSLPIPSRLQQGLGSEWTLAQNVVDELQERWPMMVDLFAIALNYRLPVYFSSLNDPMAVGTDAFLQEWDGFQAYAFPLFARIRQVVNELCFCKETRLTLTTPLWPQKEWSWELLSLLVAAPVPLPSLRDLLRQPHFHRLHQNLHLLQLHEWQLSSNSLAT